MEILKVENLRKEYGEGNSKVIALDGVNLEIDRGEFVAIVGPSGSGENSIIVTDTIIKLNQGLKASTKFLNKMILIWICHLFVEFTK